jgi:hypothetical protein
LNTVTVGVRARAAAATTPRFRSLRHRRGHGSPRKHRSPWRPC